jgi:hypothetical protein
LAEYFDVELDWAGPVGSNIVVRGDFVDGWESFDCSGTSSNSAFGMGFVSNLCVSLRVGGIFGRRIGSSFDFWM